MSKEKRHKRRKEWEKGCEADGGNEDELMSCWQTLFTLSGEMTEGRSYRKKKTKAFKKHSRWVFPLQAFNLVLFGVAPHERSTQERVRKVERCRLKKGVLKRGRAIFWALNESARPERLPLLIQSPLPISLRSPKTPLHCIRTHTHTHTEQITNTALRRNHEALLG